MNHTRSLFQRGRVGSSRIYIYIYQFLRQLTRNKNDLIESLFRVAGPVLGPLCIKLARLFPRVAFNVAAVADERAPLVPSRFIRALTRSCVN